MGRSAWERAIICNYVPSKPNLLSSGDRYFRQSLDALLLTRFNVVFIGVQQILADA